MYNSINQKLPYKSIRAINDANVVNFLKSIFNKIQLIKILNDTTLEKRFLTEYKKWILSSKLNKLDGLKNFKYSNYANGSSQIFDYFYDKNKSRRFRAFKGEYAYHFTSWRNHFPNWKHINNLDIKKNDAVVISLPFSDTGSKHVEMEKLIEKCDKLNVPVLVDCCYFSMCKGIKFNFNHKSIKEIAFSLSKAFPVSRARIGMRLSKIDDDDPLFFINKLGLVNRVGAFIGLKLIKKFKFDYIYKKYFKKQLYYCHKLSLKPSAVVCLGVGGKIWKKYNRGNKTNRLCLSRLYEKK
jgi:hypothetical protein